MDWIFFSNLGAGLTLKKWLYFGTASSKKLVGLFKKLSGVLIDKKLALTFSYYE
jgi:hypothetical protein